MSRFLGHRGLEGLDKLQNPMISSGIEHLYLNIEYKFGGHAVA
jgi:hypothetical protein